MKGFTVIAAVLALFTLTAFTGCEGDKSAAPVADDVAWCKTKYSDEAACNADERCKWNTTKAKCGDK